MNHRSSIELVYEQMLMTRYAANGVHPDGRAHTLDRSATVLLARLLGEGPMTVAELADALELDVSTVHRQVAAAMKRGLVERGDVPAGGAARPHRATAEGERRYREELEDRRFHVEHVVAQWPEGDLDTFVGLLRRFNESAEELRGKPWPRREG